MAFLFWVELVRAGVNHGITGGVQRALVCTAERSRARWLVDSHQAG